MTYAALIRAPDGYGPAAAFNEVAETVDHGLCSLGLFSNSPDCRIVFGGNLAPGLATPGDILYNLEQRGSPLLTPKVLDLFRRHKVWDYSSSNVEWLRQRGITVEHVPIGYMPQLMRIEKAPQDIDVLFYGALNGRRKVILAALRARGLRVEYIANGYGAARDAVIARSKIVLNVHYYDSRIFEIVRCSYLFANRACVVSETSDDVPPELADAVAFAPFNQLAETCSWLAAVESEREKVASAAFEAFSRCSETEYLSRALQ